MFALSHDQIKLFIHHPSEGMAVPLLFNLSTKHIDVKVPSVYELNNEYSVYERLNQIPTNIIRSSEKYIEIACRLSQECSTIYREQISNGGLTVSELRWLFKDYYKRTKAAQAGQSSTRASTTDDSSQLFEDVFERSSSLTG